MSIENEQFTQAGTPVIAPVEETPVVTVQPEPEERIHKYQPTDDNGRALGGVQVIKYRTPEELADKLQEQNVLLIRRLRAETRKNRLGISESESIPEDAPRYSNPVKFAPRVLSADERIQASRDILDPERFDAARDVMFESALGVRPEQLRATLETLQEDNAQFKAQAEVDEFIRANPSYVKCQENSEAITSWMVKNDLAPVRKNFQQAFEKLRKAGILIEAQDVVPAAVVAPAQIVSTEVAPEPVVIEPAVAEPVVVEPAARSAAVRIPTGLNRSTASEVTLPRASSPEFKYTVPGTNRELTGLAAVNALPSDDYRRRLNDPKFVALVNRLEDEAAERKNRGR